LPRSNLLGFRGSVPRREGGGPFRRLHSNQTGAAAHGAVIETRVYPRFADGFCGIREYTTVLFSELGLHVAAHQLDELEREVSGLPPPELSSDNLEDPLLGPFPKAFTSNDTATTLIGKTGLLLIFVRQSGTPDWLDLEINGAVSRSLGAGDWMENQAPAQANVNTSVIQFIDRPLVSPSPLGCGDDYACQCNDWMNDAATQLGYTDQDWNGLAIDEMSEDIRSLYDLDNVVPLFMVRNLIFEGQRSSYSCSRNDTPRIALNYFSYCIFWVCFAHDRKVYIHESLHAFGAVDEYYGQDVSACNDTSDCTRLFSEWDYPNANCNLCPGTKNSIMKCCGSGTSEWPSPGTRGMIGWGDHDADGVLDPHDACMRSAGTWCHGCAEPACSICQQATCPSAKSQPHCSNLAYGTSCNSDFKCSSGVGNNRYGRGGPFACQGFCDGYGYCDAADNCTDCNSFDSCESGTYMNYSCDGGSCVSSPVITDVDGDGFDVECDLDCDDQNAAVNPGSQEVCDGLDNDCEDGFGNYDQNPQTGVDNVDEDFDGVNDCYVDRCLDTVRPEAVPTGKLAPQHSAEIDGDLWLEVNHPQRGFIDSLSLDQLYGCTCEQILEHKPGADKGEIKHGCSPGTLSVWLSQTDWASRYGQILEKEKAASAGD
jgi:hypothetical protein